MQGQTYIGDTQIINKEINELLHRRLDTNWLASEWKKLDMGVHESEVHPFVRIAYRAHKQINDFVKKGTPGITEEIFELAELAIKINDMSRKSIHGLGGRISRLISSDFKGYNSTRYELQVGGMLVQRGHRIEYIEEKPYKTSDILISGANAMCEVECKYKDSIYNQAGYIRSIYNTTQTARRQFSKFHPGLIFIEIDKQSYDDFMSSCSKLEEEINRALRNSESISGILLTSKIVTSDEKDFIYRHRVFGYMNSKPRHHLPIWIAQNLVNRN